MVKDGKKEPNEAVAGGGYAKDIEKFEAADNIDYVRGMQATWKTLAGHIDAERYEETRAFLAIQEQEAKWWRDASVLYFQTFAKRPIQPDSCGAPSRTLEEFMAIDSRYAPGN